MTSVQKRKQLVNELRKAHFPFGFDQSKQQSEYLSKYPHHKLDNLQQPNENGKKNNFSIGNENDISATGFQSQFKEKFQNYQIKGKQEAIGAKNVGFNNIVFGYQNQAGYHTNYKDEFEKKTSDHNRVRPGDVKKNNIEFGDTLTDFTTTYGQVFQNKSLPFKPNNTNPVHKREDSKKSNLMFGNDQATFETQNAVVYKSIPQASNSFIHQESNSSNINFGSDKVAYASECQQRFTSHKSPERQIVEKDVIQDFRSAHFHFGFPQENPNFQSQSKNQYGQKPLDVSIAQGKKSNNINLNVDGKNYFESSYHKQYENWGVQPRSEINKHGRKDNILIGTDVDASERYVSEAKDHFVSKPMSKVDSIKLKGTLQLGEEPNDFRTQNQMTYDNKFDKKQNNKLSQADINKMKAINIVTGFEGNNYSLHSSEYGKRQGERGQLQKEALSKMKKTNIVLETVPNTQMNQITSYKAAYPYKINQEY